MHAWKGEHVFQRFLYGGHEFGDISKIRDILPLGEYRSSASMDTLSIGVNYFTTSQIFNINSYVIWMVYNKCMDTDVLKSQP